MQREAGVERATSIFRAGVGGERSRRDAATALGWQLPELTDQVVAVLTRHPDVRDEDRRYLALDLGEGLGHALRDPHRRAELLEDRLQQVARVFFVVDDQHTQAFELRESL